MAISNQYGDREYKKFIESTSVAGQIGVVVLNPDGSNISGGGGGGGSTTQYQDGTAVAGGQVGIVNMASDGSNLQFLSSNSSGELNLNNIGGTISLPTGAATESTLNSALTKLTDIETNTDALATVTKTTVGSDTGLDVNVISGINVEVDLDAADDSVLVYGFDGSSNQKITTDANGHLQVDVLSSALPSGAATEATLANLDTTATAILADTAAIDTSTASVDTKLTTTNSKLTDIETNTDSLAVVGGGTEATAVRVTLANDSTGLLSVDDNGGSLTVDNAGLTELAAAINSSKVDVNISSDGAGLATQTTLAAVETDTGSIDTKLTTTNSKLTDIETNTDSLAGLTKTTVSSDTGLDVNIIGGVALDVNLSNANDDVLIYGFDGSSNQKIKTDSSGNLQVDIVADAAGLATQATLANLDTTATAILADTAAIDTSTASIDTKLTTTNSKLTDIETNTNYGAVVGGGVEATALRVTLANDSTGVLSVDDNGGSLTVDNAGLTELAAAINSNKVDVNISSDGAGLATQTTLAAVETDTGSIDTKLTTTNSKLTDIETNTDFGATTGGGTESGALRVTLANNSTGLLSVDDNGGSLTVDDGGGSLTIDGAVTATVTRQASIQQSQAQGTGNIALAVATGALIKILSVNTKFGAVPTANNLDMTIVDLGNPVFNTIIFSANPGTLGITDISYIPDGEVIIGPAQEFHVTFTNAASTQFGVTITYEIIN
tara:strand:- start:839 stop:3013 length:2175 start_codon:yes stop_codon:yes gene_type:complete